MENLVTFLTELIKKLSLKEFFAIGLALLWLHYYLEEYKNFTLIGGVILVSPYIFNVLLKIFSLPNELFRQYNNWQQIRLFRKNEKLMIFLEYIYNKRVVSTINIREYNETLKGNLFVTDKDINILLYNNLLLLDKTFSPAISGIRGAAIYYYHPQQLIIKKYLGNKYPNQ
jgi:hypothetical protein